MIFAVSLLLALSLSVGSTAIVDRAFRTEIDSAARSAEEDMELFGMMLEALCLTRPASEYAEKTDEVVRALIKDSQALDPYDYAVIDEAGNTVVKTAGVVTAGITAGEPGVIRVRLASDGDVRSMVASEKVMLMGKAFTLVRSADVSEVFARAETNLAVCRTATLAVLLAGIAVTTGFTFYFTAPLRKLSRAAHSLSGGQYSRRVAVKSGDELGKLSRDFNAMAESLEKTIRELEEAAAREKDFTASFAHELKTPLTSVIGYADMLRGKKLSPEGQKEAAEYIFSEGKRLESMSRALLSLFSLEKEEPVLRDLRFRDIADGIARSASRSFDETGVRLVLDVQGAVVRAEPDLLKVLILNLLDNARKASAKGDRVILRGERTEKGYRVSVTDQGCGIPREALKKITEPFYMVDKSRAREQGGAGLGLALCRKIAELHGTGLYYESEVGKGTCVSFILEEGTWKKKEE
ncbi:MAG: HAMP domain-containing histidine kinase [Clostridia bacterium]|nr:HAMP domain-containing histidine kinase [Clostridia bacterium]